ncbi:MAG: type II toxin-antitoxin system HicB family antitoxin [Saprospiraceae bacterium]
MVEYLIIIKKAQDGGYGGYVPDLPGCIGMGGDYDSALENTIEAIKFHMEGLQEEGMEIPASNAKSETLILT